MDITQQRARTFDRVAQRYDTARPSYPSELIQDVEKLAQLQTNARILEIGTGTGKATVLFAQRGYTLHCLEPGSQLAAVAAENLHPYPTVTIETVTFEAWPVQAAAYDLVMSAQAFHWIDPAIGYAKAAQALKSEGQIALIWTITNKADTEVTAELDQVYQTCSHWQINPFEEQIQEREAALSASPYFGQPVARQYPWSQQYTTQQCLDLVSTQSDYLIQSEAKQQELLDAIAAVLDNNGGTVTIRYTSLLLLASKAPGL